MGLSASSTKALNQPWRMPKLWRAEAAVKRSGELAEPALPRTTTWWQFPVKKKQKTFPVQWCMYVSHFDNDVRWCNWYVDFHPIVIKVVVLLPNSLFCGQGLMYKKTPVLLHVFWIVYCKWNCTVNAIVLQIYILEKNPWLFVIKMKLISFIFYFYNAFYFTIAFLHHHCASWAITWGWT